MKTPLHTRMLIGGLIGAGSGLLAHWLASDSAWLPLTIKYLTQPAGQIFLRLLFMLILPLIFSALALGVTGLGDLRQLGRIGLKTLIYTVAVSAVAVLIGITLVNLIRPGEGMSPEVRTKLTEGLQSRAGAVATAAKPVSGLDLIVAIVPRNPIQAAAEGDYLAVMFFSLMIGIGLALTKSAAARQLEATLQGLYDVTMKLIDMVIQLAPFGVAALLFTICAQVGHEALLGLGRYVLVVVTALLIHQFVVYSLTVWWLGGMSPRAFFRGVEEAMLTAFSTASSNATLPTAIKVAEENLKLPPQVARFVLTIGSTANQNGSALFEGVTALFLAQFFGVPLSFGQELMVVGICILGGVGTAGVPAGSLPVVALILSKIGVPPEGIGLVLGVDRFLDMCRTTLNVTGDLAAAVVISRGEGSNAG